MNLEAVMEYRIEKDTLGEVRVPKEALWRAQTERSRNNFVIGTELMPLEVIYALLRLKKSAAIANFQSGKLSETKKEAIVNACDELLIGKYDNQFPLKVWQTGSGTQSNMNVNEVVASLASREDLEIHPNDDVNMSQSSNDTFPSAMHIAAREAILTSLLPKLEAMEKELLALEERNKGILKCGRTHLQDATPLAFSQEVSGWRYMLVEAKMAINLSLERLNYLAIGGTAVGTGINAPKGFGNLICQSLNEDLKGEYQISPNYFHALTSKDALVFAHGAIKALACNLMKIANDIRHLGSGPRTGLGELILPANEPGSSIMPGKVNPTQCEALTMVAIQVMGNDATIGIGASQGNFELNVFMPVIIYNFLNSVRLISDAMESFTDKLLKGLRVNEAQMKENLEKSLMLVTALNPIIGYENAAKIAKKAYSENTTLKEACLSLGLLDEASFAKAIDPSKMIGD